VSDSAAVSVPRLRAFGELSVRFAMLYVLIGLVIAAQIAYPNFLSPINLNNLLVQNAGVGVVAIGMTFVLIAGGFDLSVSGTLSLGSVLFAGLTVNTGFPVAVALVVTLIVASGFGAVNGIIVTKLKVNAFITTLGTAAAFGGVAALYSASRPITAYDVPGFDVIGTERVGGISLPVIVLAFLFVIAGIVLHRSTYGRNLFAVGGNREAARLAGLPVDRIIIISFVICAASAALAGATLASVLGVGQIDQLGSVALDSIAAVVIGGTSLFGGEGAIWRTAVGVLILATLNNLFSSLAVEAPLQNIVKGAVVIAAVAFGAISHRRKS
jgi:ribose transport system permease protein